MGAPARARVALARASSSIRSEKSVATISPPGPTRWASSSARSPVPVATSSARPPGRQRRQVGGAPTPLVVQPGGHHRVHAVVQPGDPVEHRPDLGLLQGAWCAARRGGCAPGHGPSAAGLLQLGEEADEVIELLRGFCARLLNDGIGAVGLRSVDAIAPAAA